VVTLAPWAAARKSARCRNRSMAMADVQVRRSAACGPGHAAWRSLCDRPWLPSGRGIRDGACAPACSVDRSASRVFLRVFGRRCAPSGHQIGFKASRWRLLTSVLISENRPVAAAQSPAAYKGGAPAMQGGRHFAPRIGQIC
jgi:hypothetical protein